MSTTTIPCPVCIHTETDRARRHEHERCDDDMGLMSWALVPRRAGGCVIERGEVEGLWTCEMCRLQLTPNEAFVLLDAVLRHSHPDCDCQDAEGYYGDARRAITHATEKITKHYRLEKRIRDRMRETGERYTVARVHVLAARARRPGARGEPHRLDRPPGRGG